MAGTVIDVTAMILLIERAGLPVGVAAFLGAASGAGASFALSKFWAFRDPRPLHGWQVGAYAMVALGTALCVALSVHTLAVIVGLPYLVAKAISAVLVFLCWSYPAQSRLVFPRAAVLRRTTT